MGPFRSLVPFSAEVMALVSSRNRTNPASRRAQIPPCELPPPFDDLIANGVHDDTGMIPVPQHHGSRILLPVILKTLVIVMGLLAAAPAVEILIDRHDPQAVASVQ